MLRPTRSFAATLSIAVTVFVVGCSPSSTPAAHSIQSGSMSTGPDTPSRPTNASPPTIPQPAPTSGPRPSLVLPTSDWNTRSPSSDALLTGKLVLDPQNCVRIQPSGATVSQSFFVLWPGGYTIEKEGAIIDILDTDGRVVARLGDTIETTGGAGTDNSVERAQACTRDPLWGMQSPVTIVAASGPSTR